jgi:predicted nucleic acid-binding protein
MPVSHLLDTSVYSQPIRKTPHPEVMKRWQLLGDTSLVTCSICEAEVLFGIQKERRKNSSTKIGTRYDTLLKGRLDILPVDAAVAAVYADLRCECEARGQIVPAMDLLIASVAMANNLVIATLNVADFQNIKGITIEDWSQPQATS